VQTITRAKSAVILLALIGTLSSAGCSQAPAAANVEQTAPSQIAIVATSDSASPPIVATPKPSPKPTLKPSPKPTPKPIAKITTKPTHKATPKPAPIAYGVHPGAFCSQHNEIGFTSAGTRMRCTTKPGDVSKTTGNPYWRWRAA
jgi:cell division protein FtsN